jgi:flagellar biogenesis protein FliO
MTEAALFIFGGVITFIVFIGVLLYAMMSFSRWSDRDSKI